MNKILKKNFDLDTLLHEGTEIELESPWPETAKLWSLPALVKFILQDDERDDEGRNQKALRQKRMNNTLSNLKCDVTFTVWLIHLRTLLDTKKITKRQYLKLLPRCLLHASENDFANITKNSK